MTQNQKVAVVVLVTATAMLLAGCCIFLEHRINGLESRITTVENDQTLIVNNMKKTVDLMKEFVMKAEKEAGGGGEK